MRNNLKIVFMGTPGFAVPSLEILHHNFNVVGVITVADKPIGRGKKIGTSPVKDFAVKHNIPLLQPSTLKSPEFIEKLKSLEADLQVVVAFRMLPKVVWNMPPKGTINLHGSLLPQYRGAAPINWAVMNGEEKTGVTTFLLQQKIDTGNILFKEEIKIGPNDTVGQVHDKMMLIGADLLLKTVVALESGDYKEIPQAQINESTLRKAPKIFKTDCKVNWNKEINTIYNHIRGLSPYPTAWTEIENENKKLFGMKIFKADKEIRKHRKSIGQIETDSKEYLKIYVKNGAISLKEIQLEGKKKMPIDTLLRGFRPNKNYKFN